MLALFAGVFTASLLGSTHCAGMCGAFAAFAVGASTPNADPSARPSRFALNAAYNLGRLATYLTLGALAGAVGAALDLGGDLLGLQRAAAFAAGAIMVLFGIVAILRRLGLRLPRAPIPAFLLSAVKAGHARAFHLAPLARAAVVGLLTTLLPCGWLYAFVVTSAATAHPIPAAAVMAAFWLGTLPVMGAIGLGAQALTGPLKKHLPLATSLLLVAVGLWTLLGRAPAPALAMSNRDATSAPAIPTSPHDACHLCDSK